MSNVRLAVEIYRERKNGVSLVILDLIMPVMDGYRCLEEILRIDPEARVLIASGYAPDGVTKETLERRTKGFVKKPFDVRELLHAVRKAMAED